MQQLTTEQLDQRRKQREAPKFFLYKLACLSPLAKSQAYSQCSLFNVAIQSCALRKIEKIQVMGMIKWGQKNKSLDQKFNPK